MIRFLKLSSMLVLLALMSFGCSSDPGMVKNDLSVAARGFIVPMGATINSATLHIYVSVPSNNSVNCRFFSSSYHLSAQGKQCGALLGPSFTDFVNMPSFLSHIEHCAIG